MEQVLRGELQQAWAGRDVFALVQALDGEVIRDKEGRRTSKFTWGGRPYYCKLHRGVGWREIFKNFSQLKRPVLGAGNEWQAINRVRELGLNTLNAVAYGRRGWNPAAQLSFLVTEELSETLSLAVYAEKWPRQPPTFCERRALIREVATIARTLHAAGINHRDLYICHFLLDRSASATPASPRLFLVDLHRAQIRPRVPMRWRVKDLASIYFSSLDIGLTRRDVLRFLQVYFDQPLREVLRDECALLNKVSRRAVRLYRRDFGRKPKLP